MRFEILPNIFLTTVNDFRNGNGNCKLPNACANGGTNGGTSVDTSVVTVNLSKDRDNTKNQFFNIYITYCPHDPKTTKQKILSVVANAYFQCRTTYILHDMNDIETVELFLADFLKTFAGGNSYKSNLLDTIRLNLKYYQPSL
jgi:hypothetical protein